MPSLATHIKEHKYSKETVFSLLDECIISDLEKLGLSDLIPKLRQEIAKLFEQERDCHSCPKKSEPSMETER